MPISSCRNQELTEQQHAILGLFTVREESDLVTRSKQTDRLILSDRPAKIDMYLLLERTTSRCRRELWYLISNKHGELDPKQYKKR